MTQLQTQARPAPATLPHAGGAATVLQRKCACGGSAGLSGECEECQRKALSGANLGWLQTKLAIGAPGDRYEHEADRVADQVVRMRGPLVGDAPPSCAERPTVQGRTSGDVAALRDAPPIVHDVLASSGQPLDETTRSFFEPRFGHDFSQVRVHGDRAASESARAVSALAYTSGQHIVTREPDIALSTDAGRRLLAHELTHVIQQTTPPFSGAEAVGTDHSGYLQRQPQAPTAEASAAAVTNTVPWQGAGFQQLTEEHPEFSRQLARFSARVWELIELANGPLTLSGVLDFSGQLPAVRQLTSAVTALRGKQQSMSRNARYTPVALYSWLEYADRVLGAIGPVMDLAEPGVSGDDQETDAIRAVRSRLPDLKLQLAALRSADIIRTESERIETENAAKVEAALERNAAAETPQGRRNAAAAFTREYVNRHWRPDLDQASNNVQAITLGRYYLYEQRFASADIQAVLEDLRNEDPELYDHALFGGQLIVYLLNEGVMGLDLLSLVPEMRPPEKEGEEGDQESVPHVTGAGFYAGFELTWRHLSEHDPIDLPPFSAPTPIDIGWYLKGFHDGIYSGFWKSVKDAFWDVVSVLNPYTWASIYTLVTTQLSDERWKFQQGQAFAKALRVYLQDVADDDAYQIGTKFGGLVGYVIAQVIVTVLGAKLLTLATEVLGATRWGKSLVEFGARVGDTVPWRDPRVLDLDDLPPRLPVKQISGIPDDHADSPVRVRTDSPSDLVAVPRPDLGEGVDVMIPPRELGELAPPRGRARPPAASAAEAGVGKPDAPGAPEQRRATVDPSAPRPFKEKEPIPSDLQDLFEPEDFQPPAVRSESPASPEGSLTPADVRASEDVPGQGLPSNFEDPVTASPLSWNSIRALAARLDVDFSKVYRQHRLREGVTRTRRSARQEADYVNPARTSSWNTELYGYWEGMDWAQKSPSGHWEFWDRDTGTWIPESQMDRAHVVDAVLFDKLVKSRAAELEELVGKGLKQPEAAVAEIRAIKYRFMHDFQNFRPQSKAANRSEGSRLRITYEERIKYLDAVDAKLRGVGPAYRGAADCFAADTVIQTVLGPRRIDQITVGDAVLSFDPVSGRAAAQSVSAVFVRIVPRVLDIQVADTVITCSPEHPFWVPDAGWRPASTLKLTESLLSNAERLVEVKSTRSREGAFQVFNVEVDGLHTYQVSDLAILVHNKPVNLAGRAGLSAEVLTAMRAQAERLPKGTSRDDRLRALDTLDQEADALVFRAQRASSAAESTLIGDEIAALEERIIDLGPETTFVRSPSESTFAQLASLEERAYYTRQQIDQLPDARPSKAQLRYEAERLQDTLNDIREGAAGNLTPEELEGLVQPDVDAAEDAWAALERELSAEPLAAPREQAVVPAVAAQTIDPNIPVGTQLAGRGQLRDLRTSPNIQKGVDLEELLRRTPAELEAMKDAGTLDERTFKQIMKTFEGRDLGKRGRG